MKITCSLSMGQYRSIKEDVSYLERGPDKTTLQPDTRRFLRQALEKAEIKAARREEKRGTFRGLYEAARISGKELRDERTV